MLLFTCNDQESPAEANVSKCFLGSICQTPQMSVLHIKNTCVTPKAIALFTVAYVTSPPPPIDVTLIGRPCSAQQQKIDSSRQPFEHSRPGAFWSLLSRYFSIHTLPPSPIPKFLDTMHLFVCQIESVKELLSHKAFIASPN